MGKLRNDHDYGDPALPRPVETRLGMRSTRGFRTTVGGNWLKSDGEPTDYKKLETSRDQAVLGACRPCAAESKSCMDGRVAYVMNTLYQDTMDLISTVAEGSARNVWAEEQPRTRDSYQLLEEGTAVRWDMARNSQLTQRGTPWIQEVMPSGSSGLVSGSLSWALERKE